MARKAKELSAIEVSRLKTPGLHAAGGVSGLYLQVAATGGRSWVLRATIGSKRRDMGLGGYPDVTLAGARDKARAARVLIDAGSDPILIRQQSQSALRAAQANEMTFAKARKLFVDARSDEWRNAKHLSQWTGTLETYADPFLGKLQLRDITHTHVLQVLEPIWKTKTETAKRLRGRLEQIFDWAKVHGYRTDDNPARWRGHLDKLLPKPSKVTKVVHHRAVAVDKVATFVTELRKRDGIAARALEMLVLTAARSGEIRGATWQEIDLKNKTWTVPAERMKAGKEHRVPLTDEVILLLKSMPRFGSKTNFVFPSPTGRQMSDMTIVAVMRRMKVDAVPHGFRSTFRDWAAERTNYPRELAEMALAHAIENRVEAAYRRGDLFEKRRVMMSSWSQFCANH